MRKNPAVSHRRTFFIKIFFISATFQTHHLYTGQSGRNKPPKPSRSGSLRTRYPPTPPVQIANGIEECASLDELSEKVGFEVRTPQALPFDPESVEYSSYWGDFAQVDYDGEGMHITYRVSAGSGDISGDYNDYADTAKLSTEDAEVTLKGSVGNWQLAIWKDGDFSFSLSISPGLSEAQLKDIISNIK